jgi:hypothetical protein
VILGQSFALKPIAVTVRVVAAAEPSNAIAVLDENRNGTGNA